MQTSQERFMTVTVEESVSKYNRYNVSIGKTRKTCQNHAAVLKRFVEIVGKETLITAVTVEVIEDYRGKLFDGGIKAVSVNTNLRSVKAFLRWSVQRGWLATCPDIEFVKERKQPPKPAFSDAEFETLLTATESECTILLRLRAKAIVLVLYDTGMRVGELCAAKFSDIAHQKIDGEVAHLLHLYASKTDNYRLAIFREVTWQAIQSYRAELAEPHGQGYKRQGTNPDTIFVSAKNLSQPLTVTAVQQMLNRLEKQAKIHCNPHKFRRTFADRYLNNTEGGEIEILGELGGWSNGQIIREHYARYRVQTLVRAYRRTLERVKELNKRLC
jgi:site-specific recombinase XerD